MERVEPAVERQANLGRILPPRYESRRLIAFSCLDVLTRVASITRLPPSATWLEQIASGNLTEPRRLRVIDVG